MLLPARRDAAQVLAVVVCLCVCLSACVRACLRACTSVCHTPVLYRNGCTDRADILRRLQVSLDPRSAVSYGNLGISQKSGYFASLWNFVPTLVRHSTPTVATVI